MYKEAILRAVFLLFVAFVLTCYASVAGAGWGTPDNPPSNWDKNEVIAEKDGKLFNFFTDRENPKDSILKFGELISEIKNDAVVNPEKGRTGVLIWKKIDEMTWVLKVVEKDIVSGKTKTVSMLFERIVLVNNKDNSESYNIEVSRIVIEGMGDVPPAEFLSNVMIPALFDIN